MGTILAIVMAAFFYWSGMGRDVVANSSGMGIIFTIVGSIFLVIPSMLTAFTWIPLQSAELRLTPRIIELFKKDVLIISMNLFLFFVALVNFILAVDILSYSIFDLKTIFLIWIPLLGLAVDALFLLQRRIFVYLEPQHIISLYSKAAHESIKNQNEIKLCQWIDALSEKGLRSIQQASISLCNQVIDELQNIAKTYLSSSKSITHSNVEVESKSIGNQDRVSYVLFYILHRLEMINDGAVEKRLEPVCSSLITAVSKMVVYSAEYDLSLVPYPLPFLGRFSIKAQRAGLSEVGAKTICALLEIANIILTEIDITYMELQEPFFSLITQMHEITKEMFRQDKNMRVKILVQPFIDLKKMFENEKMAAHPDTAAILQRIDSILAEFEALENVLKAMPTIS